MSLQVTAQNWTEFKNFLIDKNASFHYIERSRLYELFAFSSNIVLTLQLSKNPADLTDLNDFETNFKNSINGPLNPRSSTLPSKSKTILSDTKITLPKNSAAYYDLLNVTGAGLVNAFVLNFESKKVNVRLEIDNDEIFAIDCSILDKFPEEVLSAENNRSGWIFWSEHEDCLSIQPPNPWEYKVYFKIQIKSSTESQKDLERYLIQYTKDK